MTTAAVLMVRDERDVIEYTLRHLLEQVDFVLVADNGSTDGTFELMRDLERENMGQLLVTIDDEIAYFQSRKMSALADRVRELGYDWIVPADADEIWVCEPNERTIAEHLLSIPPDVLTVNARLFHYLPTALDGRDLNPFARIGWRLAGASSLPKVAVRLRPGLVIEAGNHGATYDWQRPRLVGGGLRVNHYSWRSPEQYARKIRNGARAYAATDLPEEVGPHWRMWGDPEAPDLEERAAAHFRLHFHAPRPPYAPGSSDPASLVYDPAVTE